MMKLNFVTYQVNLPAYQIYSLWTFLLMSSRCTGRTVKCLLHSITVSKKWRRNCLWAEMMCICFISCNWRQTVSEMFQVFSVKLMLSYASFFFFLVFLTIQLTGIKNIFNIITGILVTYHFIICFLLRHSVTYFLSLLSIYFSFKVVLWLAFIYACFYIMHPWLVETYFE